MKSFKTLLTATLGAAAISATAWADTSAQAPNQVVYLPQLPSATELSQSAAAQGQTVSRIEQSNGQVTAVYSGANGQTTVVSYQLLPTPGQAGVPTAAPVPQAYAPTQGVVVQQPATPAPVVTEAAPATTVVYGPEYAAYPYDYYPGYGYYGWYPGIRVGLGWGYGYGYHGGWGRGYYHGGYHGGYRGAVHGGGGRGGHR